MKGQQNKCGVSNLLARRVAQQVTQQSEVGASWMQAAMMHIARALYFFRVKHASPAWQPLWLAVCKPFKAQPMQGGMQVVEPRCAQAPLRRACGPAEWRAGHRSASRPRQAIWPAILQASHASSEQVASLIAVSTDSCCTFSTIWPGTFCIHGCRILQQPELAHARCDTVHFQLN